MINKRKRSARGFTLTELLIGTTITIFVILAIGMALVDGQRGWNQMYNNVYSDVVTDGYVARRKFDAVLRKASGETFSLAGDGSWVEYDTLQVGGNAYLHHEFPSGFSAHWVRVVAGNHCRATAYFVYT